MKKVLLISLMILSTEVLLSQAVFRNGYIVTNNGDSIQGLIEYKSGRSNSHSCTYKDYQNTGLKSFSPLELKGYGFIDDKIYESKKIGQDEQVFFEVLVKGIVTLYKLSNSYYIQKNDGDLYILENEKIETTKDNKLVYYDSNKHIGILLMLLSDCEGMDSRIPNITLGERALVSLIEDYNFSMDASFVKLKKSKPWIKVSAGLSGFIIFSDLKFINYVEANNLDGLYETSPIRAIGISIYAATPRLYERLSFQGDILYFNSEYHNSTIIDKSTFTVSNNITIKLTQLKIPIGVRYTFRGEKIAPFFNLGILNTVHLRATSDWSQITRMQKQSIPFKNKTLLFSDSQFGFWAGAGLIKPVTKRISMFVDIRCEYSYGITATIFERRFGYDTSLKNLQIGFGFKAR